MKTFYVFRADEFIDAYAASTVEDAAANFLETGDPIDHIGTLAFIDFENKTVAFFKNHPALTRV